MPPPGPPPARRSAASTPGISVPRAPRAKLSNTAPALATIALFRPSVPLQLLGTQRSSYQNCFAKASLRLVVFVAVPKVKLVSPLPHDIRSYRHILASAPSRPLFRGAQ